jgi:HEPN domain-containing protein
MARYYMNDTVREWVMKADKDFATALRELHVQEDQNFDAVCSHAQQNVEKLMKGLLIYWGVTPTRTHDLAFLSQMLNSVNPAWSCSLEDLRFLTRAAVAFRYPGEAADREEAAEAFTIASRLRQRLVEFLKVQNQQ